MGARIGLYGGAFDPPHLAHSALVSAFAGQFKLDALHVVPTGVAYHRTRPLSASAHRLAMAHLAFGPPAVVDDLEIKRDGPSYTIDTALTLVARYGALSRIHILVGEDQWSRIASWHRIDELTRLATFIVATRPGGMPTSPQISSKSAFQGDFVPLIWRAQDVSATQIREAVALGRPIDSWVKPAVARYIAEHQLYRSAP
jgi:nicotinate-nucleotide adenylyltransferase